MTGHWDLTEDKHKRRGSQHGWMTGKGNLSSVPKKVPPCWYHSGTPSILPVKGPPLPGLSPRTHSDWIQSNPASPSVSAVPLLTTGLLLVTWPFNYSCPWGRDALTPWAGTLRNSTSSLPYLTPTALIHPREGAFREGLFLSNSRPPASLLRKWRGWSAVSKDPCVLPNLSSTVSLHSLGRVPVGTAGRDPPHPRFNSTMQVKEGKPAHLLLFWSIINAHLSSVSTQKHWKQRN